ncbi:MAG: YdeI/OmpD-associated family protein [Anaerolineae bacterium]
MKIGKTIYCKTRDEWRAWLEENHATEPEIWLIYYKKGSDRPRVPYDEAVQEALCFGWIDSTVQRVNEAYYVQKFSPRRPGSAWSLSNKQRVAQMIKEGRMTAAGLARVTYPHPERMPRAKSLPPPVVPPDLARAVTANPQAQENFARLTPATLRMYVNLIEDAKKPETRERRIKRVLEFIVRGRRPDINDRL